MSYLVEAESNLVGIRPFNMRNLTLANIPLGDKRSSLNKAQSMSICKLKENYITSDPFKSINLLRSLLQEQINCEINALLQKYSRLFFQPAIDNITRNVKHTEGFDNLNIKFVLYEVLDEAKKMYHNNEMIGKKPFDDAHDFDGHAVQSQRSRGRPCKLANKDKMRTKKMKAKLKNKHNNLTDNLSNNKWNNLRLTTETLFVLGSRANKALGFGTTRGRLYSKHSNLFRYIGDQEDKEWLYKNELMPTTGGKAYLLVKDDISQLISTSEYKNMPGVNLAEMGEGFTVPQSMIDKMSTVMESMRRNQRKKCYLRPQNNEDSFDALELKVSSQTTSSISDLSMLDVDLLSSFIESGSEKLSSVEINKQ